jgi:hypothetical protein
MRKILTVVLLILSSTLCRAQQNALPGNERSPTSVPVGPATLLVTGHVKVNKQPVSQLTSTVFKGDQIETASGAAARVSAPGLSVYLPANSCLAYSGQELEMCNCGSIDVNAMKPVSVIYRDRELVVSSGNPNSAFTMSVTGRDLHVLTHNGSAEVARSGSILTRVISGSSRSFAGLGCVAAVAIPFSSAGVAAAAAVPAVISTAVIKAGAQRPQLSSTTP